MAVDIKIPNALQNIPPLVGPKSSTPFVESYVLLVMQEGGRFGIRQMVVFGCFSEQYVL